MKVSELQTVFLSRLQEQLVEWKFVKTSRHFKKANGDRTWFFHISCINHPTDFDGIGDVAVEFKSDKERICIAGAELGRIEGIGQKRFEVGNPDQAVSSADAIYEYFLKVGLPFLEKYSDPSQVISDLESGGQNAMMISPLISLHQSQIVAMKKHYENGI